MLKKFLSTFGGKASVGPDVAASGANARVLIIDDDHELRTLLKLLLESRHYAVLTAGNGREGVETARRECPDAIILDGSMPEMDGIEALRRLRRTERTKNIPVVMLTMRLREGDVLAGLRGGAQEYLTKPVIPEEVFNRLKAVLERHR